MAWSAIDDQITREFSFIQELVWSAPYRNPFPSCTNMIISDLKALNVCLRSNRYKPFRHEIPAKTSKLDANAKILDYGALKLIEFRRFYCNRLLQLQRILGEERLLDLENKVDGILVQHMQNAWENGLEGRERVDWTSNATQIDFTVLDQAVHQIFDSFQVENNIKPENLCQFDRDTCKLDLLVEISERALYHHPKIVIETCVNSTKNGDKFSRVEDAGLTEQNSCSPQTFEEEDDGEDEEEESCCDSYNQSTPKSSVIPTENNVDAEIIELEDGKLCIHSPNGNKASRFILPKDGAKIDRSPLIWPRLSPNSRRRNYSAQHLEVEMVMKSRLRRNPEEEGAHLWHIIFGLVNHGACKLEVNSLSFWSMEGSSGSDQNICSIKWPKGDVILLEGPSFLCYSTKMPCSRGSYDSPRVAYSWKYRRLGKRSSGKSDEGKHASSKCNSSAEKEAGKFKMGSEDSTDAEPKTPIYKRLGSIMLEWSANSLKRMKRS